MNYQLKFKTLRFFGNLVSLFLSTSFAVCQVPTITSFSPSSGPIGTEVTITGSNFDSTPSNNIVFFGATQAAVSIATSTELIVSVPAGATYEPITVLVDGLLAYASTSFVVTFEIAGIYEDSFDAEINYPTSASPWSMEVGDFDGDGESDIVVSNLSGESISVLRNTSTGIGNISYADKSDLNTGEFSRPIDVAIGDLDGDGAIDIGVVDGSKLSIYRNSDSGSGSINFDTRIDIALVSKGQSVDIVDVDGDGKSDIVVAIESNFPETFKLVSIFQNNSTGPGSISFENNFNIELDTKPTSVLVGDLDSDNKPDLVLSNRGSNSISVFRNTSTISTISYDPVVYIPIESSSNSVAIGDLNDDGKPDLVVSADNVVILKNTSSGPGIISYADKINLETESAVSSLYISDLNGDGKLDLTVATKEISIFKNTGTNETINFASKLDLMAAFDPYVVSVGDLDNDGRPEIVTANSSSGNNLSIFRNLVIVSAETDVKSFSFVEQVGSVVIDNVGHNIAVLMDFGTDLTSLTAVYNHSPGSAVQINSINQVSGSTLNDFSSPITYTVIAEDGTTAQDWLVTVTEADAASHVTISSFSPKNGPVGTVVTILGRNFDPVPENNIVKFGATLAMVEASTTTELTVTVPFGASFKPISVLTNGLIANSDKAFNVTFEGSRIDSDSFDSKADLIAGSKPSSVSIGDLDGDGLPDLAVTNYSSGTVSVYRNISPMDTIIYDPKIDFSVGSQPESISIGDLDGDGKDELVISNRSGRDVSILRNVSTVGSIDFEDRIEYSLDDYGNAISLGDFDRDGKVDMAATQGNYLSIMRNISSGVGNINFGETINYYAGAGSEPAHGVTSADMDGDGRLDLAVVNFYDNTLSVFRNNSTVGTISFAEKMDYATSPRPESISAGDLDGDGLVDLVVVSSGFNNQHVTIFKNSSNTGNISFEQDQRYWMGTSLQEVAIADINGDSKLDLAVTSASSNSGYYISVFMNASQIGSIAYDSHLNFETGSASSPESVAIGDLNGDGKPDMAVANNNTSSIAVFRNTIFPNTETDIIDFSFAEQTGESVIVIDTDNNTIGIEVVSGTDRTNLVAFFALSYGASAHINSIQQISGTTANDFTNQLTYSITAEDGITTLDWAIIISEGPASSNTDIVAFSMTEQAMNANIDTVNHGVDLEIAGESDKSNLIATFILSNGASAKINSVVQVSGVTANDFTDLITYAITAQDGTTTQDWSVNIYQPGTEANILGFALRNTSLTKQVEIDVINHTVHLEVERETDLTNLVPEYVLSEGASAKVGSVNQFNGISVHDFTTPITYTIIAENGSSTQDWVVSVNERPLGTEAEITSFGFAEDPSPNIGNGTIESHVPYGTDLTSLVASFTLSNGASARVGSVDQVSDETSNDFTNDVTYKVTSEDETNTKTWVVTVIEALNVETKIVAFSLAEQATSANIDDSNQTINIEVKFGTALTDLKATFVLSDGAIAQVGSVNQISGTTPNDFTSPVIYQITAEDGETNVEWVVKVTIEPPNTGTDIISYTLDQQTGPATISPENHTVEVEVSKGTNITALVPNITLSPGASITPPNQTTEDFTNPVTYTVTAEDESISQEWVVSVTIEQSIETDILDFSLAEQNSEASLDANNHTIDIEVVNGTNLTSLVPTIYLSDGASVNPDSQVAQDFTNPVSYTVTAEDGITTQDWVVTITMEAAILGINDQIVQVVIYPNPVVDILTIELDQIAGRPSSISLTNLLGQELEKVQLSGEQTAIINVSKYPPGTYLLQFHGSKKGTIRFVKQ